MEFSKIRNKSASTNLLILDEISSMLDPEGENGLYDILLDLVQREDKCIITISHSGNIDPEKITRLYNVSVAKGFSKLERIKN
jgi:energy-coupling factor transporter ATP-binding protein EcfA2